MGIFFVYILKSSVCLTIFYLFYKLLLSRDTFHRFNRIALLSLIMLSVIIPFCEITLEEATAIQRPVMDLENLLAAVSMRTSAESASQPVWLRVMVELDMRARLVELNEAQAIVRGPLVLARDSRFKDGDVDEASVIVSKDGYVELTPVQAPDFAWMAFTVPMVLGTDLEGNGKARPIHLCDFASAGNTWNQAERYRVWLPKTWNVMRTPYKPY